MGLKERIEFRFGAIVVLLGGLMFVAAVLAAIFAQDRNREPPPAPSPPAPTGASGSRSSG